MPTPFSPMMIVGAALFFAGGAYVLVAYFRGTRLALGTAGLANLRCYLQENAPRRRRFFIALGLMALGGLTTCSGVMAGDAKRNRRCRAACNEAGYPDGRFRGNPHEAHHPGATYACWCQRDSTWSHAPVAF